MKQETTSLIELKLENVTYAPITVTAGNVTDKNGRRSVKQINVLNNITTTISPYKLSAWMGPSGSGKTSLISVAADLIKSTDLKEGSLITVNGEEGRMPKRMVGVVWQDDLLMSNLTVEENLYFAARLKTPSDISDSDVTKAVEETLNELGLLHIRNSLVGNPLGEAVRGISGGERKRLSVGNELVERPALLLLDEPTSGLDATTAFSLISTLKDLAAKGRSIAVVIHQPRTTIFNMFDHLLMLSKGHTVFDGHPSRARAYLESCPSIQRLPPETGIADWIMDVIIEDENKGSEKRSLLTNWSTQHVQQQMDWSIPTIEGTDVVLDTETGGNNSDHPVKFDRRLSSLRELKDQVHLYDINFWKQLKLLTYRTVKQQRGERITSTAFIIQFTYLAFTSLFWWQLPDNTSRIFERNSLFFFILVAQANGIVTAAVTVFQRERTLLKRERAKKMYRVSSFFIAKTLSDMSTNVLLPVLYGAIAYWTAGYRPTATAYFKFLFSFYWALSTAQSMGLYISVVIPNPMLALILAPPVTLFFMIVGGFYIPFKSMNVVVKWMSYLSFARYSYSSLIINEYEGRSIPCADHSGTDNQSIIITECPLPGINVIEGVGIEGINQSYWFNVGMVIILQLVFRFAAYASLRRSKRQK